MAGDPLDSRDRATLGAWRALNMAGWWAAGVAITFGLQRVVEPAFAERFFGEGRSVFIPDGKRLLSEVTFAVVTVLAVGSLIGSKVAFRPAFVATLAVFPWLFPEIMDGDRPLVAMATVVAAFFFADLVSKRSRA